MNEWLNLLSVIPYTGDEAKTSMWIWIMVIVGVILVVMGVVSVVMSKREKGEKKDTKKDTDASDETKK